jgi:hypothetical protein
MVKDVPLINGLKHTGVLTSKSDRSELSNIGESSVHKHISEKGGLQLCRGDSKDWEAPGDIFGSVGIPTSPRRSRIKRGRGNLTGLVYEGCGKVLFVIKVYISRISTLEYKTRM